MPGLFSFEHPPAGLDLLRAPAEELHRYGIPHRPDPKRMPRAFRHWTRMVRRVRTVITPQLELEPTVVHGPVQNLRQLQGPSGTINAGSNWSGLVVYDAAPYTQVWGTWTVPNMVPPPQGNGTYNGAVWVGLGGYGPLDPHSLLQAGTNHRAGTGALAPYAWLEWFPGPSYRLMNFVVSPGDSISVSVGPSTSSNGSTGTPNGSCTMVNLATGVAFSIEIAAPTQDYTGQPISPALTGTPTACAEWIVERTSTYLHGQTTLDEMPDYGQLTIQDATAEISNALGKGELAAAAADAHPISIVMIADDGTSVLSNEAINPVLQFFYDQTTLNTLP